MKLWTHIVNGVARFILNPFRFINVIFFISLLVLRILAFHLYFLINLVLCQSFVLTRGSFGCLAGFSRYFLRFILLFHNIGSTLRNFFNRMHIRLIFDCRRLLVLSRLSWKLLKILFPVRIRLVDRMGQLLMGFRRSVSCPLHLLIGGNLIVNPTIRIGSLFELLIATLS